MHLCICRFARCKHWWIYWHPSFHVCIWINGVLSFLFNLFEIHVHAIWWNTISIKLRNLQLTKPLLHMGCILSKIKLQDNYCLRDTFLGEILWTIGRHPSGRSCLCRCSPGPESPSMTARLLTVAVVVLLKHQWSGIYKNKQLFYARTNNSTVVYQIVKVYNREHQTLFMITYSSQLSEK